MKKLFLINFIVLINILSLSAQAQNTNSTAKVILVKTRNNQNDSTTIALDLLLKQPINLPYDQNYLLFRFKNTDDSTQKSFVYFLKGLDYNRIQCNDCSEVQYAHLDGGTYTFQVKPLGSKAPFTEFQFSIEEKIWYKWWFIPMLFLYFLAIVGIAAYFWGLLKLRQKLKEQRHIHQAKMTSMAELTAGIAHEIQNPLNFVNNFSELSVELAQELKEETEKIEFDKELIADLANDLMANQKKISQHGQRASGIVKGMLEHSKVSLGEVQLTDINKLIGEQFLLSKKAFESKEKYARSNDFYVELDFQANEKLPKIKVIPQEIDKALLNIFNNAFYALYQQSKQGNNKQAKISILSKSTDSQLVVNIKDNGMGIPKDILPKIFQPFFTTKPTGEGTGLGLSLAYDIITKGHNGTIEVESVEGEGTTFIITLPLK